MKALVLVVGVLACICASQGVYADDHAGSLRSGQGVQKGDWLFRIGGHRVSPKSSNHDLVEVEAATMLTFNVSYFFQDQWAVEVLAALPFEHDIKLRSGGRVASTKHLPPTVSVQYHFTPDRTWRPYVGLGLNVTEFFQEDTTGALAGADLELDRSFGLAAQVGVDFDLGGDWFANVDVRYFDIETDAKVGGADIGTVEIDPWAVGLSVGIRL